MRHLGGILGCRHGVCLLLRSLGISGLLRVIENDIVYGSVQMHGLVLILIGGGCRHLHIMHLIMLRVCHARRALLHALRLPYGHVAARRTGHGHCVRPLRGCVNHAVV